MRELTLAELCQQFDLQLGAGADPAYKITGLAPLQAVTSEKLSFFTNPIYKDQLAAARAGVVILCAEHMPFSPIACLLSNNPYASFAAITALFDTTPRLLPGIHPTAVIADSARIAASAAVGPHCVVGEHAVIGERCQLAAGVSIGEGVIIGDDCDLRAQVVLAHQVRLGQRVRIHPHTVIGADGFGFAPNFGGEKPGWRKIHQLGGVIIHDDVEIGANSCVDRGTLGDTEIGQGAIIDNLVQIAHNVKIGAYTAIAACTGIAGSTEIGAYCTIAGAVGIVGHIKIADRVHVTAKSLVTGSITEAGSYSSGTALMPTKAWRKSAVRFTQLDKLFRR